MYIEGEFVQEEACDRLLLEMDFEFDCQSFSRVCKSCGPRLWGFDVQVVRYAIIITSTMCCLREIWLLVAFRTIFAVAEEAFELCDRFVNPEPAAPLGDFVDNEVWDVGRVRKIQWITSLSGYSLVLWQRMDSSMAGKRLVILGGDQTSVHERGTKTSKDICRNSSSICQTMEVDWPVKTDDFEVTQSPVFFFGLLATNGTTIMTSHCFNVSVSSSSAAISGEISAVSCTTLEQKTPTANSTVLVTTVPASGSQGISPISSRATLAPPGTATKASTTPITWPGRLDSSTLFTSPTASTSSSQQATARNDSTFVGHQVAVISGFAVFAVGGVFVFWKFHKWKKMKLELKRRQQREHWPRLTIFNVPREPWKEQQRSLGSNDARSEPWCWGSPVELEGERPVAEMPQDQRHVQRATTV